LNNSTPVGFSIPLTVFITITRSRIFRRLCSLLLTQNIALPCIRIILHTWYLQHSDPPLFRSKCSRWLEKGETKQRHSWADTQRSYEAQHGTDYTSGTNNYLKHSSAHNSTLDLQSTTTDCVKAFKRQELEIKSNAYSEALQYRQNLLPFTTLIL